MNFWRRMRRVEKSAGGSILIIVMWIAFGLVSLALYFGQAMSLNLQAADNSVAAVEADQAIEGAVRYIEFALTSLQQQTQSPSTNMPGVLLAPGVLQCYMPASGQTPFVQNYQSAEVPVGGARFWLIGRDSSGTSNLTSDVPVFGLVDEASKLNLNTATLDMLQALPMMPQDVASSILNWRSPTNKTVQGGASVEYATLNPPYSCKNAPFETVDELKLVMGVTTDILYGADLNLNGIMDPNESAQNIISTGAGSSGGMNGGILDCVTVFTREPNTRVDGTPRLNINGSGAGGLSGLLEKALGKTRSRAILQRLAAVKTCRSMLEVFVRSGMTADEFAKVSDDITVATNAFFTGLVNVNTASAPVLACLPGVGTTNAQAVVTYRQTHPDQLANVTWLVQVLGANAAIQAGPYVTTKSYQFSADVVAVGRYGRGYRRVLFVFDTSCGAPQVVYRRDLGRLGWALGNMRQKWQLAGMM